MTTQTSSAGHTEAGATHRGACFCGAVQLTVTGEPVAMGYCHCDSCRHWSASAESFI